MSQILLILFTMVLSVFGGCAENGEAPTQEAKKPSQITQLKQSESKEIVVRLCDEGNVDTAALLESLHMQKVKQPSSQLLVLRWSDARSMDEVVQAAKAHQSVCNAQPNYRYDTNKGEIK